MPSLRSQGLLPGLLQAHLSNVEERALNRQPGGRFAAVPPILERLKRRARELGLWNLFLGERHFGSLGAGLSNAEYAVICEVSGRSRLAPEACNCNAPDSGNMEVLARYGTEDQKKCFLAPLLEGRWRSAFLMTEPDVASSDASNIACTAARRVLPDGSLRYRLQGTKWWSTGGCDPRLRLAIVLCRLAAEGTPPDDRHRQHSVFVVPLPHPGVQVKRHLSVFGYDDAPFGHAEIELTDVEVGPEHLLLGEGQGFEIAQGRLGPGRVHHCSRALGLAERALSALVARAKDRVAFGKRLIHQGTVLRDVAECRLALDQARLLVHRCASKLDEHTSDRVGLLMDIAAIKVVVPRAAFRSLDCAVQVHGGLGVCEDTFLARAWASMRTLRLADGPDEVHLRSLSKFELKAQQKGLRFRLRSKL